jgi:hypothetical protein
VRAKSCKIWRTGVRQSREEVAPDGRVSFQMTASEVGDGTYINLHAPDYHDSDTRRVRVLIEEWQSGVEKRILVRKKRNNGQLHLDLVALDVDGFIKVYASLRRGRPRGSYRLGMSFLARPDGIVELKGLRDAHYALDHVNCVSESGEIRLYPEFRRWLRVENGLVLEGPADIKLGNVPPSKVFLTVTATNKAGQAVPGAHLLATSFDGDVRARADKTGRATLELLDGTYQLSGESLYSQAIKTDVEVRVGQTNTYTIVFVKKPLEHTSPLMDRRGSPSVDHHPLLSGRHQSLDCGSAPSGLPGLVL